MKLLCTGSFIYALNAQDTNLIWGKINNGQDDNGKQLTDDLDVKTANDMVTRYNNHDRLTDERQQLIDALDDILDGESPHDMVGVTGWPLKHCEKWFELLNKLKDSDNG